MRAISCCCAGDGPGLRRAPTRRFPPGGCGTGSGGGSAPDGGFGHGERPRPEEALDHEEAPDSEEGLDPEEGLAFGGGADG